MLIFAEPILRLNQNWLAAALLLSFIAFFCIYVLIRKSRPRISAHPERFLDCFQQALIGIAFEDMNGRLLEVNPRLCAMLGYSEAELLTMSCDKFASSEDQELEETRLFDELRSGLRENYRIEKTYTRKDGTQIWGRVLVCKLKVRDQDSPMVLAMVEDITEQKKAEQSLSDAQGDLQELAGRLIYAQEEERRRIARELHDDIGQRLSILMVELEQMNRTAPPISAAHVSLFQKALRDVDELTRDIHELSHQLHSTKLSYVGITAALRELCAQVASQQQMVVSQDLESGIELPSEVQLCLYRVAQEALNNVVKHSGASSVSVYFRANNGMVRLEVADSGVGFDPAKLAVGLGLASMRERVRTVRGELAITSNVGKGTKVTAVVPYDMSAVLSRAA